MSQESLKPESEGINKTELKIKDDKSVYFDEDNDPVMGENETTMVDGNKNLTIEEDEESVNGSYSNEEIDESLEDELISEEEEKKTEKNSLKTTKPKHKIKLMTPSMLDLEENLEKEKLKEKSDRISPIYSVDTVDEDLFNEEFDEIEEQEEEIEEERVKDDFIDKEAYMVLYSKLQEEKKILRRRNAYLHRKMTEHLKKRNLESLLKDSTHVDSPEVQEKYEKKLLTLAKKIDWHTAQKEKLTGELELMKKQVDEEQSILDQTFQDFLKREREITVGLIDTSTGQPISDRVFNRLLNLQKQKFDTIGDIRLECIRLRDKVNKKEKILESIETIGDNLHLVDYEHLCIENQNYTDKNEERDEELSKLHNKSAASIQILAHIRQKSYATAVDFQVMEEKLKDVEAQLSETRENLNLLKVQRDTYRSEAIRLRESSGLLTQMKLLHDFENTNDEIIKARVELESIKEKFDTEQEELRQLQSLLNAYGQDKKSPR